MSGRPMAIFPDSTALLPLLKNGGTAKAEFAQRAKNVGYAFFNHWRLGRRSIILENRKLAPTEFSEGQELLSSPNLRHSGAMVSSLWKSSNKLQGPLGELERRLLQLQRMPALRRFC